MEYKVLNNGLKIPMVGLGVYNISERETQRVVEDAISVGYRSIDTDFYPNTFLKIVNDAKVIPVVNQCDRYLIWV